MAISAFVMRWVFSKSFRVIVPRIMTRKAAPSVLGRMLQHYAGRTLPSTRSILSEYRRLGGQIGHIRGRQIVNSFRDSNVQFSDFLTRGRSVRPKVSDTVASLFSEKTKYRYSMSNTQLDVATGKPKTTYVNFNANRLLTVGEMQNTIADFQGYDDWHPESLPFEDWKLEMIYRNAGPGVDITLPAAYTWG